MFEDIKKLIMEVFGDFEPIQGQNRIKVDNFRYYKPDQRQLQLKRIHFHSAFQRDNCMDIEQL